MGLLAAGHWSDWTNSRQNASFVWRYLINGMEYGLEDGMEHAMEQ